MIQGHLGHIVSVAMTGVKGYVDYSLRHSLCFNYSSSTINHANAQIGQVPLSKGNDSMMPSAIMSQASLEQNSPRNGTLYQTAYTTPTKQTGTENNAGVSVLVLILYRSSWNWIFSINWKASGKKKRKTLLWWRVGANHYSFFHCIKSHFSFSAQCFLPIQRTLHHIHQT